MKEDPRKVEGLFAANVPYSVVEWFKKETGCNILECEVPHVIDSWAKVGDEPGELIFRSGFYLGKMVKESKENNLKELLSEKFQELAEQNKNLLGEEIAPHVFYKELKKGDHRPIGIHISNSHSECLAILERQELEDSIIHNRVSLGLKKEYLESLSDEEWEQIKQKIIFKIFPYFKPAGGGSGPQKKLVPLFLTEKKVNEQEVTAYPQKVICVHKEIKEYIKSQAENANVQEEESNAKDD